MPIPADSYALLGDLRFHYRHCGPPGGAPVVLLHGLASNARIWDFVAPLLGRARRALALDQRGHGLTDKPDDGYDFAAISADLGAFIQALDLERPVVVGHSWGASVALYYAATRPVGPWSPSAIALVDGGVVQLSALPGMTWEQAEERLRPPPLAGMPRENFLARMAEHAPDPAFLRPEIVEVVLGNFEIMEDDTIRPHLRLERHMRIVRAMYDLQSGDLWRRVRCPILLAPAVPPAPRDEQAEHFLAAKRAGVALAESLNPAVQTRWFEDTVHDIPLHRPAELSAALEAFMDGLHRQAGE
jgi:pimeloyl-ACP methyl ester carboxylesterase